MVKKVSGSAVSSLSDDDVSDKKSARTRRRILDAAAKVLSTKGYAGMRLGDVAEVAEVQASAIYYYFSSRDELIEEVMWSGLADMRAFLTHALDDVPAQASALERILVAVEAHLRHELAISDYTTASIRNAGQLPEHIRSRHDAEEKKYGAIWRDLFKQAYAASEIREDLDPYVAQMLVMGTINWAAEWWQPNRSTIDRVVSNAQSYVRHALAR